MLPKGLQIIKNVLGLNKVVKYLVRLGRGILLTNSEQYQKTAGVCQKYKVKHDYGTHHKVTTLQVTEFIQSNKGTF